MEDISITTLAGLAGLAIGFAFGVLTQWTNFCTMGAVADAVSFGDMRRGRAWLLGIAVAIIGVQGLQYAGLIDLSNSIYIGSSFNLVGSLIGGLIFGFGMVLASGCPGRNLVRVGSGDLKALVVLLFIGIFGYATIRGLTGLVRVFIEDNMTIDTTTMGLADHGLGTIVSGLTGLDKTTATLIVSAILVVGIVWFCFKDAGFRGSKRDIIAGLGLGALITAGWYATGVLLADEFDPQPLTSLTFVAPSGDALQYFLTFTGSSINFAIATVLGGILGAFVAAYFRGRFAISGFSNNPDTIRHLVGGAMMGFGGVTALGCTIGQGLTGVSTLALGSFLAAGAIVIGGIFGMKYLERALGI